MTAALDAIRARDTQDWAVLSSAFGDAVTDETPDALVSMLDRHILLTALDRAEAVVEAARVAHDAWFGGLIDSDYDRMASIFDALRAALRAYEDADKVADDG